MQVANLVNAKALAEASQSRTPNAKTFGARQKLPKAPRSVERRTNGSRHPESSGRIAARGPSHARVSRVPRKPSSHQIAEMAVDHVLPIDSVFELGSPWSKQRVWYKARIAGLVC